MYRLRAFWPKGQQRGSQTNSHHNRDYLKGHSSQVFHCRSKCWDKPNIRSQQI